MPIKTDFDLNLIRVFLTIYETGRVSTAAEILNLTQPTISYSLKKLREALNDPLFSRTANGMKPTLIGELTYSRFLSAIGNINNALDITRTFDPEESSRQFRITMSDIGELIFLPPIVEKLKTEAPNIELQVIQVPIKDVDEWLSTGKIDLAVGNFSVFEPKGNQQKIFKEKYVCLMSKNHPSIKDKLTISNFTKARHILVSSPFSGHSLIEESLKRKGVTRKISLQIEHFTILPRLLAESDLIVTLPSRVAKLFESYTPLTTHPLPIKIPEFDVGLLWHHHQENDPGHSWLKKTIYESLVNI